MQKGCHPRNTAETAKQSLGEPEMARGINGFVRGDIHISPLVNDEITSGDISSDEQAAEQPQSPFAQAADTTSEPDAAKNDDQPAAMDEFKAMKMEELRSYMKDTIPGFRPTVREVAVKSGKTHQNWKSKKAMLEEFSIFERQTVPGRSTKKTQSVPLNSEKQIQKQIARKRKTEAEKLQPFDWDKQKKLYPPNNERLGVPTARYQPQPGGFNESSGEEATEPQSPANQIAAFTGVLAAAAPGAPANGHVSDPNDAPMDFDQEDPMELEDEYLLAKIQREEMKRKQQQRLKQKKVTGQKKKKPSTTGGEDGAPKKKQQQSTTTTPTTTDMTDSAAADGPSKVVGKSARLQAAVPDALITPGPAAAPPAPPSAVRSSVPLNRPKTGDTTVKSVNPQNLSARFNAHAVEEEAAAAGPNPSTSAAAPPSQPVAEPQPITVASPPLSSALAPTPTSTRALARIIMESVLPLSSILPVGTVSDYLSNFARMTQEEKETHAVFVTRLAQGGSSEKLQAFVQLHSQ